MKIFTCFLFFLVLVASPIVASAAIQCDDNDPHRCYDHSNRSVADQGGRGRDGYYRSSGRGSYDYRGHWEYGGQEPIVVPPPNGGDAVVVVEKDCRLWGLIWCKSKTTMFSGDGYHDVPQGPVIRGKGEVKVDDEETGTRPPPIGYSVPKVQEEEIPSASFCGKLELLCRDLKGKKHEECWEKVDECRQ